MKVGIKEFNERVNTFLLYLEHSEEVQHSLVQIVALFLTGTQSPKDLLHTLKYPETVKNTRIIFEIFVVTDYGLDSMGALDLPKTINLAKVFPQSFFSVGIFIYFMLLDFHIDNILQTTNAY